MFQIRYRIVDDLSDLRELSEQEIRHYCGIGGYIELICCKDCFGFYYDGVLWEDDCGWEDIDYWLNKLLEVVLCLIDGATYVAFSLIETFDRCLEFRKYGNWVSVTNAPRGNKFAQTLIISGENTCPLPKDIEKEAIRLEELQNIVCLTASQFVQEAFSIEPLTKKLPSIQTMEHLINEVRSKIL